MTSPIRPWLTDSDEWSNEVQEVQGEPYHGLNEELAQIQKEMETIYELNRHVASMIDEQEVPLLRVYDDVGSAALKVQQTEQTLRRASDAKYSCCVIM